MNCNEFELLLADALGDELSDTDRPAFEEHLSQCETCRREYETATGTVRALQSLSGPHRITIEREDDRLVIREASSALPMTPASIAATAPARSPGAEKSIRPFRYGLMRYAASVLVAFTAGYGLHAGLILTGSSDQTPVTDAVHKPAIVESDRSDFQNALVSVHTKNPARSDLAKGMIAIFANKG